MFWWTLKLLLKLQTLVVNIVKANVQADDSTEELNIMRKWLALLLHSQKAPGFTLAKAFLCGVCTLSLCMCRFLPGTSAYSQQLGIRGVNVTALSVSPARNGWRFPSHIDS